MSILSIDLHSSKSTIKLSFHFQNITFESLDDIYYVLQPVVVPHFNNHPLASRPVYMDDNARPHRSRAVTAYLQSEAVTSVPWPASKFSTGCNPHMLGRWPHPCISSLQLDVGCPVVIAAASTQTYCYFMLVSSAVDRDFEPQSGQTKTIELIFAALSSQQLEQRLVGFESG
jgi:hypothetical protein